MKHFLTVALLLTPGLCLADTFILNDGARIEGEVTGEMDGALLIKTRYGALTVNKADIKQQVPAAAAQSPAPLTAQPAPQVSTTAAVEVSGTPAITVSTEAAAEISTGPLAAVPAAMPPAAEAPLPRFTFATVEPSTSARLLVYSENGVAIATETYDSGGALLATEGAIKDGTYTEYYGNGGLKTVKSMIGGRVSGTLKAYYPSGALQIEAYYMAGSRDGQFRYYAENGKPLLEAAYKDDKLNGLKQEFDADGAVKSETYYIDDHVAEPPKPPAPAAEQPKERDSLVTVKSLELARGERFSFQLNGKYIGRLTLDSAFNILNFEGNIPDGAAKAYSKDGKLQKEFVFEKNALKQLRVYEDGGPLKATYAFKEKKFAPFLKEEGEAVKQ